MIETVSIKKNTRPTTARPTTAKMKKQNIERTENTEEEASLKASSFRRPGRKIQVHRFVCK